MPALSALQGALWGQFVGDAAALGTHWIYDLEDMAAQFPGGVRGFETPQPGHYHEGKKSGDQTHYGDAALLLLESVAACGEFREADFGMRFEAFFRRPGCKAYKDHATRETLANLDDQPGNYQNGADDDEPATVTRIAPVVAAYLNRDYETAADAIHRLTLVTQNNAVALACVPACAELLRQLLKGTAFADAFEITRKSSAVSCDGSDYLEFAYMMREMDVVTATGRFGQTCHLPQSFPSALQAALHHQDSFEEGILNTVRAGGDNAGRAAMVGYWLGASLGIEAIPQEWIAKLRERERIDTAIDQLLARCTEQKAG
jgi:ADP-ribosylglycohydrolase